MEKTIITLLLCTIANYGISQTIVNLALPDNCNKNVTLIEKVDTEKGSILELFPNPNTGIFTLAISFNAMIEKAAINIYDTMGKTVFTENIFSNSSKLIKQINISDLLPGIYILDVKNTKQETSIKLVIKN
jgi:hypothetical protein